MVSLVVVDQFNSYWHKTNIYRSKEFNATFNNISVISWRSVLLVKETGVHSHSKTLSHDVVSNTPHPKRDSNSQF